MLRLFIFLAVAALMSSCQTEATTGRVTFADAAVLKLQVWECSGTYHTIVEDYRSYTYSDFQATANNRFRDTSVCQTLFTVVKGERIDTIVHHVRSR
jgi:hypothetical protein